MKPDPKFGWHILWLGPLLWIRVLIDIPMQYYYDYKSSRRIKQAMKDPEIAEMVRLAGLPKRKNKYEN
jgi:hypothetical protein